VNSRSGKENEVQTPVLLDSIANVSLPASPSHSGHDMSQDIAGEPSHAVHYDPYRGTRLSSSTYYYESARMHRASIANVLESGRLRRCVTALDREAVRTVNLIERDIRLLSAGLERVRQSSGRSVTDPTGLPDEPRPRCIMYGEWDRRGSTSARRRGPVPRCRPHVAMPPPLLSSPGVNERSPRPAAGCRRVGSISCSQEQALTWRRLSCPDVRDEDDRLQRRRRRRH
jgi:hypothetical protein